MGGSGFLEKFEGKDSHYEDRDYVRRPEPARTPALAEEA